MRKNILLIALILLIGLANTTAQDTLTVSMKDNNISMSLENKTPFTACQMDVILPYSVSVSYVALSDRLPVEASFSVATKMIEDNVMRILAYSTQCKSMTGTSGELMKIRLNNKLCLTDQVEVKNVRFVRTSDFGECLLEDAHSVGSEIPVGDTDISKYSTLFYVEPVEASVGSDVVLSVKLKNETHISGFSMNFCAPEGFRITDVVRGERLMEKNCVEEFLHSFETSSYGDGSWTIECHSAVEAPIAGNDGEVARVTVSMPEEMEDGSCWYAIRRGEVFSGGEKTFVEYFQTASPVNVFVGGDANGDGLVAMEDITAIAQFLQHAVPVVFNKKAADVNGDGRISVGDITTLTQMLHQADEAVGDVNGDGIVSIADANIVVNYYIGITPSVFNLKAADVNKDGEISINDANSIVNKFLER